MLTEMNKAMIHLDTIRIKKKITVEKLCEGICGDRQYRKYLSGANNISEKRLFEFYDKLGISSRDFYFSFYAKDEYYIKKINYLYSQLINNDLSNFDILIKELDNDKNLTKYGRRFLNFIKIRYQVLIKKITNQEALSLYSNICNYPKCTENEIFDFVDILAINHIANIETKQNKDTSLNLLLKILTDDAVTYISSDFNSLFPNLYANIAFLMGRLKKYNDCITIAKRGVKFCLNKSNGSDLTLLYYSLSIANKKLDNIPEALHYATMCFTNVIARNNPINTKKYYDLLNKDFNKDIFDIIQEHKNILLTKKADF